LTEVHGCYLTLGNFDGVHRGHVALLEELVAWARSSDRPDRPTVAITFREHPRHVLGDARPQTILPFDRRLELMAGTGLGHTVVIPFTRKFSQIPAERFVERIIKEELGAAGVLLGFNSFFGHNRRGNLDFLREHAQRFGIEVRGQEAVLIDHAPISSSRIRHAILAGDLDAAARLLGRRVSVTGVVVHGDGRGRQLGFPTANLRLQQDVLPPAGVYATSVTLPSPDGVDVLRAALTNIGRRPTFDPAAGAAGVMVETWIREFTGDLYDQRLTITFWARLRDEQRFESAAELVDAIHADQRALADYFGSA
jgi:riboflavin kinase/FMN adenylyltransferase